jgi:hypothetical protein
MEENICGLKEINNKLRRHIYDHFKKIEKLRKVILQEDYPRMQVAQKWLEHAEQVHHDNPCNKAKDCKERLVWGGDFPVLYDVVPSFKTQTAPGTGR